MKRTRHSAEQIVTRLREIGDRSLTGALASATYSAAHDQAGQMIDDGHDRGFQYDAFGRLVEVRKVTSRTGGGAINTYTVLAEYRYDGLGQRIAWHRDFDNDATAEGSEPWIHIVYDDRWRMVALFNAGDPVTEPKELLIPHNAGRDGRGGSSYIDSYAVSEFDGDGRTDSLASTSDGVLQTRRYYIQNWRADVIGMIGTDAIFQGWYNYSAYGQHQWISAGDIDDGNGNGFRDGSVDLSDLLAYLNWFENGDARFDLNGDGGIDSSDQNIFNAAFSAGAGPESRVMYAGYAHDPLDDVATSGGRYGIYHVRHRVYSAELGRWIARDPLGYIDGISMYHYVLGSPLVAVDAFGLQDDKPKTTAPTEPDLWKKSPCFDLHSSYLEFWLAWLGAKETRTENGKLVRSPVSSECKQRLLCILRAISYVESVHGTGTGNSPMTDPMQCGNPADKAVPALSDPKSPERAPVREGKLPGVTHPSEVPGRLQKPHTNEPKEVPKAPGPFSDPGFKFPKQGHKDTSWTAKDSCFWGVYWYLFRTNQRDGVSAPISAWNLRGCTWDELIKGAAAYNGGGDAGYEQKIKDALKASGCKKE